MLGCEIMWDEEKAGLAHQTVIKLFGRGCDDDFRCPLLPKVLRVIEPEVENLVRS